MENRQNSKLAYLLRLLEPDILAITQYKTVPRNLLSIEFLENQTVLHAKCLYLAADLEQVKKLSERMIFPGTVVLACGGQEAAALLEAEHRDYIGIAVRIGFVELYNRLNRMLAQYQEWRSQVLDLRTGRLSLEEFLQAAQKKFGKRIFFLDRDRQIYGNRPLEKDFPRKFQQLLEREPEEIYSALSPEGKRDACRVYRDQEAGRQYFCSDVTVGQAWRGCVAVEGGLQEEQDLPTMAIFISRGIGIRFQEALVAPPGPPLLFAQLLDDILHDRLREEKDVASGFQMLPYPVKTQVRCVILRFESGHINEKPHARLLAALRKAFPDVNTAVFRDEIVVLFTYEGFPNGLSEEERRKLQEVLEQFNASAGIGEPFTQLAHFKTQYNLVRKILQLGMAVRFRPEERILTRGDYMDYLLIDLALGQFVWQYGHLNFAYLIHPAVVHLARLDHEQQTDQLTLLHLYLLNNLNAGKTAEQVFMHRNTVINRIKKMTAATGWDLNHPALQHQLLLSCCLMRYSERYLHRSLLEPDRIFQGNGEASQPDPVESPGKMC